jgi:hypothetical protein
MMSDKDRFQNVFDALKPILKTHARNLSVTKDEVNLFYLDTKHIMDNKQPLFFGSVQVKKAYVSFYLMPVYVFPELLENVSPELKKRMQGKSCFNFKQVDADLFEELRQLTVAGYQRYEEAAYV